MYRRSPEGKPSAPARKPVRNPMVSNLLWARPSMAGWAPECNTGRVQMQTSKLACLARSSTGIAQHRRRYCRSDTRAQDLPVGPAEPALPGHIAAELAARAVLGNGAMSVPPWRRALLGGRRASRGAAKGPGQAAAARARTIEFAGLVGSIAERQPRFRVARPTSEGGKLNRKRSSGRGDG